MLLDRYLRPWLRTRTASAADHRDTYCVIIERYICNEAFGIGAVPLRALTRALDSKIEDERAVVAQLVYPTPNQDADVLDRLTEGSTDEEVVILVGVLALQVGSRPLRKKGVDVKESQSLESIESFCVTICAIDLSDQTIDV
jgi:hypothetical protein